MLAVWRCRLALAPLVARPPATPLLQPSRSRWQNKIKVDIYPCLQERLEELDETLKDPEVYKPIDIGLPRPPRGPRREVVGERVNKRHSHKRNSELEKLSRTRALRLDVDGVENTWEVTTGPQHLSTLARHYGIFAHLFGEGVFFLPRVPLKVCYDYDDTTISPVYRGNTIKPREARSAPSVEFPSGPNDLWTLILTNPDGNLVESGSECLHWFVGNIRGGELSSGEVVCDYLQPFPPRGSGYQRLVFILYKQDTHIDFSQDRRDQPCLSLRGRSFSTLEMYRRLQHLLTPAGIAWFQADWDSSLTHFFHDTLKMREPVYEYEFPEVYVAPPKYFPLKREFNTYLDLHRDPKQVSKEMLLERLKTLDPLKPQPELLPYPGAQYVPQDLPSWQKKDLKKKNLGIGKYSELFRGTDRPYIRES